MFDKCLINSKDMDPDLGGHLISYPLDSDPQHCWNHVLMLPKSPNLCNWLNSSFNVNVSIRCTSFYFAGLRLMFNKGKHIFLKVFKAVSTLHIFSCAAWHLQYCSTCNLDKRTGAGEFGVADPAAAGAQRHLFTEHVHQRCALPLCPPLQRAGCCLPSRPPHWASFLHNLTSDFRNFAKYVTLCTTIG